MPKASSMDLRERVWRAHQEAPAPSRAVLAARFKVSVSFVGRLRARMAVAGSLAAKARGGGRRRALTEAQAERLGALVVERPDDTLAEHAAALVEAGGPRLGLGTLWRALARLGFTRKKRRLATTSARASAFKPCAPPSKRR